MPYPTAAQPADIRASAKTLRHAFEEMNYSHRVWALIREYWAWREWWRVIWTDESNFNMSGAYGKTYVTRLPGEEYEQIVWCNQWAW